MKKKPGKRALMKRIQHARRILGNVMREVCPAKIEGEARHLSDTLDGVCRVLNTYIERNFSTAGRTKQ